MFSYPTAIAVLLFLVSSGIAYYFYRKSRLFGSLQLIIIQDIDIITVFEEARERVEVIAEGREITNLCRLQFVLRNPGTLPITRTDVVRPVVVFANKAEFLEWRITSTQPSNMNIKIEVVGCTHNELKLDFDLIKPEDQVTFEVLCEKGDESSLDVKGRVTGVSEIGRIDLSVRYSGLHSIVEVLQKRIQRVGLVIWWSAILISWGIIKLFFGGHRLTLKYGFQTTTWQEIVSSIFLIIVGLLPILYACRYLARNRDGLRMFRGGQVIKLLFAPRTALRSIYQFFKMS